MSGVALPLALVIIPVPGAGLALLAYRPREVHLPTRLALVFVFGCWASGGVAFVLAILRVLHPATFFPVLAAVGAAGWGAAIRRGSLREHGRAIAEELRHDPWSLLPGLGVIAAIAVVRWNASPLLHVRNSSSWRYWADAVEIADAGRIPSRVLQYGAVFPSVVNKVFLNALNAGITYAIGREPLPGLRAMLWIGSVGVAVVLWSLGRELGLRHLAVLVPILLVANLLLLNHDQTTDLNTYKAEIFGRMIAFAGVAIGIRGIRDRRGWKEPVLAGLFLGVAAGIHAVPVIIAVPLLAAYALGRMITDRAFRGVLRASVLTAGTFVVLAAVILILPRGDLALKGVARANAYPGFPSGFDPTLYLSAGVPPDARTSPQRSYRISPPEALRRYVFNATGATGRFQRRPLSTLLVIAVSIGGLLAAIVVLWRFPAELKPLGVVGWSLGAVIVLLTWLFSIRYELYIPARFGVRRLFDYGSIPIVLPVLAILEGAVLLLPGDRPSIREGGALLLVVLVAAILIPRSGAPPVPESTPFTRDGYDWIRSHTPCDARFLPSQHTAGAFEGVLGRISVLEGSTPYLRPGAIQPIIRLMLRARAFFHEPAVNEGFLLDDGIDYVVALRARIGFPQPIGGVDPAALERLPGLVRVYANEAMTIYRVRRQTSSGRFVDPTNFPGYYCFRRAIAS